MLSLRRLTVFAGVAAVLFTAAVAQSAPSAGKRAFSARQNQVLALEHRLLQARVSTNTSAHEMHFDAAAIYMHSSGRIQNKAEVLKMVAERPWVSWSKSEQKVKMYGDTAITHALLSVRLTDNRTETVRATGVYVNHAGQWRQVSWQSSAGTFVGPVAGSGH